MIRRPCRSHKWLSSEGLPADYPGDSKLGWGHRRLTGVSALAGRVERTRLGLLVGRSPQEARQAAPGRCCAVDGPGWWHLESMPLRATWASSPQRVGDAVGSTGRLRLGVDRVPAGHRQLLSPAAGSLSMRGSRERPDALWGYVAPIARGQPALAIPIDSDSSRIVTLPLPSLFGMQHRSHKVLSVSVLPLPSHSARRSPCPEL